MSITATIIAGNYRYEFSPAKGSGLKDSAVFVTRTPIVEADRSNFMSKENALRLIEFLSGDQSEDGVLPGVAITIHGETGMAKAYNDK